MISEVLYRLNLFLTLSAQYLLLPPEPQVRPWRANPIVRAAYSEAIL